MSVPTIPQLRADASQVLLLDSYGPILAVATAAIAAANQGTPLATNLTKDQLYAVAGQLITQPMSDVMSIFADQLIRYLNPGGTGGSALLSGLGNPNGVVTATGPAIYFDRTDPAAPVMYVKSTTGTSDNEWV